MATLPASTVIAQNPILAPYKTLHGTIPFDKIKNEHYLPAFEEAFKQHIKEIETICNNSQSADFNNTIIALENSGLLLAKVSGSFYNMLGAETNEELQQIAQQISPLMTEHSNAIRLNEKLFERIKAVYQQKEKLKLTTEQQTLLKKTYDGFANNGANLSEKDKITYRELSKELSLSTLTFGQNTLKETNKYELLITDQIILRGLPDYLMEMLASNAQKAGKKGWLIDLKATTYIPLMKHADNRDLRREIYMAYSTRCMLGGEYDNIEMVKKIANTRYAIAKLLGHETYADYVLVERMAQNKENVCKLLDNLLESYRPVAQKELADVQEYADCNGAYFEIQAWDFSYYSEKLKTEKFDLNDEILKPYFELENVKKGVFGLANKLFGIKFVKNSKIPVYHPEVEAFEVFDEKGEYLAVLYTDFHPREGKRAGAWMSEFKGQWMEGKKDSRPHITIVMNFTPATETKPALLTYNEVVTFLHEFGHALHGMLTKCTYETLSGTNVYRDFVELPSQMMENWASKKEFLDGFAKHYITGEMIPVEIIEKINKSDNYNAAYMGMRQLSFGFLDMAWHTLEKPFEGDAITYEKQSLKGTDLLPPIENTLFSATFNHIFSGGYAAGYYSYKWAEVLEADAFSLFEKTGIFNKNTAGSFRKNILEKGATEEPMTLYKRFRGQEPTIDALLRKSGIK